MGGIVAISLFFILITCLSSDDSSHIVDWCRKHKRLLYKLYFVILFILVIILIILNINKYPERFYALWYSFFSPINLY